MQHQTHALTQLVDDESLLMWLARRCVQDRLLEKNWLRLLLLLLLAKLVHFTTISESIEIVADIATLLLC